MVNFFNPGGNREFFGNRAQWNPARTNGNQFYGGPSQVQGHQYGGGMGGGQPSMTNWQPPARGNYPGIEGPASQPPQTGGPLPPYGGEPGGGFANPNQPPGHSVSGRPTYNGPATPGNWNPGMGAGGERPGTYGVPNDLRMAQGNGVNVFGAGPNGAAGSIGGFTRPAAPGRNAGPPGFLGNPGQGGPMQGRRFGPFNPTRGF